MQLLESQEFDPAWNLAAEEYLLKQTDSSVCFIYRNRPSVILGRNQHLLSEVDPAYLQAHAIALYRRISGGGAVYHDPGNLNIAFIENGHSIQFYRHRERICKALQQMGIAAEPGSRSDILLQGKKISGNAATVSRNRVMHHGTLLFAANLDALQQALIQHALLINPSSSNRQIPTSPNPQIPISPNLQILTSPNPQIPTSPPPSSPNQRKGVSSVPSPVVNIQELYPCFDTIEIFQKTFIQAIKQQFEGCQSVTLTSGEQEKIARLRDTKYASPEWILV